MFRLAGWLKMTVAELSHRMSSTEFAEWMAYSTHYEAIPNSWMETGLLATAVLAPHCRRDNMPKPEDFVPLAKPPQHESQILDQLERMKKDLGL